MTNYQKFEPFNSKSFGLNFLKIREQNRRVLNKPKIGISEKASIHSFETSEHFIDLSNKLSMSATPSKMLSEFALYSDKNEKDLMQTQVDVKDSLLESQQDIDAASVKIENIALN